MGRTLSPIQPDSFLYICKGLGNSGLTTNEIQSLLKSLNNFYDIAPGATLECGTAPSFYSSRITLSYVIGLFAKTQIWWMTLIPSIIISLLVVVTWWALTKEWVSTNGFRGLAVGLLPWLSPHIGLYVSLVLTEGPLTLSSLLLILVIRKTKSKSYYLLAIPPIIIAGLLVRQSWPIFAFILGAGIASNFNGARTRLTSFSLGFMSVAIVSLLTPQLTGTKIDFLNITDGLVGLLKGLRHDFWHLIQFVDLPALTLIALFLFGREQQLSKLQRIVGIGLVIFSCFTCYSVYLDDGSYGQNWRYFSPSILVILAMYLLPSNLRKLTI
jgi:hypothetical protein